MGISPHKFLQDILQQSRKKNICATWQDSQVRSPVPTYRGHVTIANTIGPLLNLSGPRKMLCASEADTLELCGLFYKAITTVRAAEPSRTAYCLSSVRQVVYEAE
jgi:hypothetical protein